MFAAWAGSDWQYSGADEYLATFEPYSILETVAVVNLGGLGRGGEELLVEGDGGLVDLLLRSAEASGVTARETALQWRPYQTAFGRAPGIKVAWDLPQRIPASGDTVETLDMTQLGRAGQTINLMLITLSREYAY